MRIISDTSIQREKRGIKMTKKLLCLVMAACLVVMFTACGGSSQSNIPLKDNPEEAENQVTLAMKNLLVEHYEDTIDDFRINVEKIYTTEDEQEVEVLKDYNLGPDEVAFEVRYDIHPSEGTDLNNMLAANGEYDEESGWVINKFGLGILRPTEDGSYEITDFGTGW